MAHSRKNPQVDRLLGIMQQLRDPHSGCPWDLQQSFESIVPFTIEEAYEVADAIENGNMQEVEDELGDLLFQVVFYAQLGKEQRHFDFESIAKTIGDKLVRRHPHVFGDDKDASLGDIKQNWDAIKKQEQQAKGETADLSVLANIPKGMAPLMRAQKLQKNCAKVGFDWPNLEPVIDKVHEEIEEVRAELSEKCPDQSKVEEELGDLLFAVVNMSRHLDVNPETALRKANVKFEARFRGVEAKLLAAGTKVSHATLDEMESIWQQVKQQE